MTKKNIAEGDKKILWAKSGLVCALCKESLLVEGKHIGEQAHIYGEKSKAARYDPTQKEEFVNSQQNLMLLCPSCHKIIDKPPYDKYTVEALFKLKAQHEQEIATKIKAPSPRLIVNVIEVFHQALSDIPLDEECLTEITRSTTDYLRKTKNPQNEMKQDYADYLCEIYLKETRYIDDFLANPNNAHTAKLLQDIARKINKKLLLENEGKLNAAYFEHFCEETIKANIELFGEKEETLSLMLFYLYWHCDIGKKK